MILTLCGCASLNSLRKQDLPAPLKVALPDICELILTPVDMPDVRPGRDDANVAFMKDEAALIVANERIKGGRACVHDMRQDYQGKGTP